MKLQNRNLSFEMQGNDVALLHKELIKLGHQIPVDELQKAFFGKATREAVVDFQEENGLKADGVVGSNTARLLDLEIARLEKESGGAANTTAANTPVASAPVAGGPKLFVIQGAVRQKDGQPAVGLTVRAVDRNGGKETIVGESVSDQSGRYKITYDEKLFRELSGNRNGFDMILRVFDPPHGMHMESNVVRVTQPVETFDRVAAWLPFAEPQPQPLPETKPFRVRGQVRWFDGRPPSNLTVRAFDKDLRSEEALGTATVSEDGRYEIAYGPQQFSRAEKESADLIVRAFDEKETRLAASPIVFNAQAVETIDLVLGASRYIGQSEFEQLVAAVTPVIQNIKPADLNPDDMLFLAGETGIEQHKLESWVIAHNNARVTGLPAEFFYGVLRQDVPREQILRISSVTAPPIKPTESGAAAALANKANTVLSMLVLTDIETVMGALQSSIEQNIVPQRLNNSVAELRERWEAHRLRHSTDATDAGPLPVDNLLHLTSLKPEERDAFLALYRSKGSTPEFWDEVEELTGMSKEKALDVQATLMLANLVDDDVPLMTALKKENKRFRPDEVKALAKRDEGDWEKFFSEKAINPPARGTGNGSDTKERAASLTAKFEQAFPTTAFVGRLEKDKQSNLPQREGLVSFLNQHPNLELLNTNLEHYFQNNHDRIAAEVQDVARVKEELKDVQRVFKLAPNYHATTTLINANVRSAQNIYFMGERRLRETVGNGDGISAEEASKIYNRAEQTYGVVLALAGEMKSMVNGSVVNVLPNAQKMFVGTKKLPDQFPNWESLFGSADLCECEHCRSVYSPAAYMADILGFLKDRMTAGQSARDVLLKRRPDLGEIELSCINSNVALPYIDLVCEILEDVVATEAVSINTSFETQLSISPISAALRNEFAKRGLPISTEAEVRGGGKPQTWFIRDDANAYKIVKTSSALSVSVSRQTHGTSAELEAQPEYVNFAAYRKLKNDTFPMSLPFDLYWEEARAYLSQIDVRRHEVMRRFRNRSNTSAAHPQALDIATEFIGFNKKETDIIVNSQAGVQSQFWGDLSEIEKVPVFLEKTGLEYKQLLELLSLKFVNPNGKSQINHLDDTCQLSAKEITNLAGDSDKLDRIHRFLRLWKKLGWKMWELDRMVMSKKLGDGKINAALFPKLVSLIELKDKLSLTIEELLGFYEDINSEGSDALYQRLFLNKALVNPVDEAFKLESVTQASTTATVANHAATFQAALQLSAEEFQAVLKLAAEGSGTLGTNGQLRLANISRVYRYALLAKKIRLSIDELLSTVRLLETAPATFDPFENPASTLDFVSTVAEMKRAAHSATELNYILKHITDDSLPVAANTDEITRLITELRQGLQAIKDANQTPVGSPREDATAKLSTLPHFDGKILNQALAVIDGSWKGTPEAHAQFISNHFADFLNVAEAKVKLVALPPLAVDADAEAIDVRNKAIEARFVYFLNGLNRFLTLTQSKDFITQTTSAAFNFPADLALFKVQGAAQNVMQVFLNEDLLKKLPNGNYEKAINETNFQSLYDAYRLLYKAGKIINEFSLSQADVEWLLRRATAFGLLDLSALPVKPEHTDSTFAALTNLKDLLTLKKLYPGDKPDDWPQLLDKLLASATTEGEFLNALAALTLWPLEKLKATAALLGITYPEGFKKIEAYVRLHDCMALLGALDISVADVEAIIKPDFPSSPEPEPNKPPAELIRIKQIVKARYENTQWLAVSKTIQDVVRERKRDALVAYLLAHPLAGQNWKDANDLFSHFLIDVEMSACASTTRILQANLSMQLFVQRCLMRLEKEVVASADRNATPAGDAEWLQWKWMKTYRMWEANRKVFLYPENWIEPELRPDKSSFFKDLENDLLQNELNHANAENAYTSYLEKLDTVARLDVCASYYDHATYTLHVFARTYDDPYIYYHRKLVEDSYWTAWQKVEADIKGDHLIPLVINNRLYLYWAEFTEKAHEPDFVSIPSQDATSVAVDKPERYWEIRMAVSEYRNKKWTGKKVSRSFLKLHSYSNLPGKEEFFFVPLDLLDAVTDQGGGKFLIACFRGEEAFSEDDPDEENPLVGAFELGGCHGTPELLDNDDWRTYINAPVIYDFKRSRQRNIELVEQSEQVQMIEGSGDLLVDERGAQTILQKTPGQFRIPIRNQLSFLDKWCWQMLNLPKSTKAIILTEPKGTPYSVGTYLPFFYEDNSRTFFVQPRALVGSHGWRSMPTVVWADVDYTQMFKWAEKIARSGNFVQLFFYLVILAWISDGSRKFPDIWYSLRFWNFYHPYVCYFIKQLYLRGIDGLLRREVQLAGIDKTQYPSLNALAKKYGELKDFNFAETYGPKEIVHPKHPAEEVDFDPSGSYSLYNWELFFHAPMLIAMRLSKNQRFEEAMRWFHYIFDPTDASGFPSPDRYWITKPFFIRTTEEYQAGRVDQIMKLIAGKDAALIKQVDDWRNDPFSPHKIAQFRTIAYQKNVVMKYIDNLIAWGDYLFKSDTRENINQATQLYVLAAEILGPRPKIVPPKKKAPVRNYYQLEKDLDSFSNALTDFENLIPATDGNFKNPTDAPKLPRLDALYFCIPQNDKLLGYWDVVADRLFKIRHCQNIEGVVRQLALFDPPIDPALLVRAAAAGLDLGSVLGDLKAPLPPYRYQTMSQKSQDFCNDVKALGNALLSALEKRDAEALALLRSSHEQNVLQSVLRVREQQIKEAEENLEALGRTQAVTRERRDYYANLSYMNAWEVTAFVLSSTATVAHGAAILGDVLAGAMFLIPDFHIGASGFGGTPHVAVKTGGQSFGKGSERVANGLYQVATLMDKMASLASTQGSYQRRKDEWDFQRRVADKELLQIDKQIAAASIRLEIAQQELSNQELQIENSKAVDEYLHSKFTNQELYEWMISQISGLYFQSYQLAYDLAKKAERCFRNELGLADSSFIQFGHWDSLRKGLLAGERLSHELRKMEAAYLEQNRRELEITKHVSLSLLDPVAFLQLKRTGKCFVKIPEALFDLDYPGHYLRRIKSVRVTIPCVTGPYTNVSATLTMLKSSIRRNTSLSNGKYLQVEDDPRFSINTSVIQSISTSNAQNDGGLFEVNLRDERYLPFEGSRVISEWRIELPEKLRQFDYDTISDVVLHFSYTARDGGDPFRKQVVAEIETALAEIQVAEAEQGLARLFSLRHEFPTEWHSFIHPNGNDADQKITFDLSKEHFPFAFKDSTITIKEIELFVKVKSSFTDSVNKTTLKLSLEPGTSASNHPLDGLSLWNGLVHATSTASGQPGNWTLTVWLQTASDAPHTDFSDDAIEDILVVCRYSV